MAATVIACDVGRWVARVNEGRIRPEQTSQSDALRGLLLSGRGDAGSLKAPRTLVKECYRFFY